MSQPARLEKGKLEGQFRVVGELSFETVPALAAQSAQLFRGCPLLQIDLGGVGRSDSAGLALLIEWVRQARALEQDIVLLEMPEQMRDIVRVSGLDNVLPFGRASGPRN